MDNNKSVGLRSEIQMLINNLNGGKMNAVMDMEAAELFDIISRLNELALSDDLTGLHNRRFMAERLPAVYNSCLRLKKPFSVAMLDIDKFKLTNDTEGHIAGDAVLKKVAQSLTYFIRSDTDFAVRYGGDEFLICFPGAVIDDCIEICERIRRYIETNPLCFKNRKIHISVSVGLASYSGESRASTIDNLVSLADTRLYTAKTQGRNRVIGE